MTPLFLTLLLIAAILFIISSISFFKVHPVLSLLLASMLFGLISGLEALSVVTTLSKGFGNMLGSIGLVIILGSIIGEQLEKTGAAQAIASSILKSIGRKDPHTALILLGGIVGIPVFCDVGYILLSKIAAGISRDQKLPFKTLSIGLAGGLYSTHTLVPPTPGPIAAAGNLGMAHQLGYVILIGLLMTIPLLIVVRLSLKWFQFDKIELNQAVTSIETNTSTFKSIFILLLPIFLISLGTLAKLLNTENTLYVVTLFLGQPIVSLLLTVILAFFILPLPKSISPQQLVNQAVLQAGPILILTGAGGAFGAILKEAGIGETLVSVFGASAESLGTLVLIGFALSAILKTSQGSSTSAIVIASSILGPMAVAAGISNPLSLSLLIMSIGGGAMTVSHANDSYFWVVSQFGQLSVKEAYKSFTLMTAIQGITVLMAAWLMSFLL